MYKVDQYIRKRNDSDYLTPGSIRVFRRIIARNTFSHPGSSGQNFRKNYGKVMPVEWKTLQ